MVDLKRTHGDAALCDSRVARAVVAHQDDIIAEVHRIIFRK